MENEMCLNLVIDEEFRRLEQPVQDGAQLLRATDQSINVWGTIILEGFARYELCRKNGLPVRTRQIPAQNRQEAIAWACSVQLKRDDLIEDMQIYLLGKRYSVEKGLRKDVNRRLDETFEAGQGPSACKTAVRLGKEYGFGGCTIERYGRFANAVDQLALAAPGLVRLILSGQFELAQRDVIRLSKLPKQVLQQAEKDPQKFLVKNRLPGRKRGRPPSRTLNSAHTMAIKQMPEHDPDAEISGLTLTIPTWTSSIQRIDSTAELAAISPQALERLAVQLCSLTEQAEKLLAAVKEAL